MNVRFSMVSFVIVIANLLTPGSSHGFLADVHKKIAEEAISSSSSNLNESLINAGIKSGLAENANDGTLGEWIVVGSDQEDNTPRYRNHFYNPLAGTGLNDIYSGASSFDWASDDGNDWSWKTARNKYYVGLTASTETTRKSALADAFRALGQVMHLVQDLASPAHVRNDVHVLKDGFEAYTKENIKELNFSPVVLEGSGTSVTPFAPKSFWDSDQYDGSNPSASNAIGLAEYTNANFVSQDTIFTEDNLNDKHYFPYPRKADVVFHEEPSNRQWQGRDVYKKYFSLEKIQAGEKIKHFATASKLYDQLSENPESYNYGLDDQCYRDYTALLIPRATGYSADLLNYYFRGSVDMVPTQSDLKKYNIKNNSDEDMNGVFELYYDNSKNQRNLLASWVFNVSAKGKSPTISFARPKQAKEPGKYILVFKGQWGREVDAVVGRIVWDNWLIIAPKPVNGVAYEYSKESASTPYKIVTWFDNNPPDFYDWVNTNTTETWTMQETFSYSTGQVFKLSTSYDLNTRDEVYKMSGLLPLVCRAASGYENYRITGVAKPNASSSAITEVGNFFINWINIKHEKIRDKVWIHGSLEDIDSPAFPSFSIQDDGTWVGFKTIVNTDTWPLDVYIEINGQKKDMPSGQGLPLELTRMLYEYEGKFICLFRFRMELTNNWYYGVYYNGVTNILNAADLLDGENVWQEFPGSVGAGEKRFFWKPATLGLMM